MTEQNQEITKDKETYPELEKQNEEQIPALMEKMHDVDSSYIKQIGHSEEHKTLAITFNNGKSFYYPEFSAEEFKQFRFADSAGKHFHAHIKKQFDCKPVE